MIGNAVRADNPEARAAIDAGLPYLSFPDALYQHAIKGKHSVVVAGTHGKTTTGSIIATLLFETGRDPSMLVGGITANFDGSFRDGAGPDFVVEGDEYDTAFFDKTPKFLHYHARTLVITSVEFDHADIYRDLGQVKDEFRKLVQSMPADGAVIAAVEEPNVADVVAGAPCRVIGYAVDGDGDAEIRARALQASQTGTRFELVRDGVVVARPEAPFHGRHNVANALAAIAVLESRGVPIGEIVAALPRYAGVKRRQEVRGEVDGVTVIDDFAHHPTAVRETLAAMRARYPGRRVIAVFEPRSNTSRRTVFQKRLRAGLRRCGSGRRRRGPGHADLQRHGRGHRALLRPAAGLRSSRPGGGGRGHRRRRRHRRPPVQCARAGRRDRHPEQRRLRRHLGEATRPTRCGSAGNGSRLTSDPRSGPPFA